MLDNFSKLEYALIQEFLAVNIKYY